MEVSSEVIPDNVKTKDGKIKPVAAILAILGLTALVYQIYQSHTMIKFVKAQRETLDKKVLELESNVKKIMGENYQSLG